MKDELPLDYGPADGEPHDPLDITGRASHMLPDSGILYPPGTSWGSDPPAFMGVIRVTASGLYWAVAYERRVRGRQVLELRLTLKS